MNDLVDQAPIVERHENRIGKGAAFDADAKACEIADAGDVMIAHTAAQHDGQRRIDIGLA